MPDSSVRFVQFPHPGAEHRPNRGGGKAWNSVSRSHARKFLELKGEWLLDGERQAGDLWAWGECSSIRLSVVAKCADRTDGFIE